MDSKKYNYAMELIRDKHTIPEINQLIKEKFGTGISQERLVEIRQKYLKSQTKDVFPIDGSEERMKFLFEKLLQRYEGQEIHIRVAVFSEYDPSESINDEEFKVSEKGFQFYKNATKEA
jgi:predicted nucleic acid-binding protein